MENQPFFITGDSFRSISKSFYKAIDNRDIETFVTLNSFLHRQLSETYNYRNINLFESFSRMLPYYYEYSLQKLNSSITYNDIYKVCTDRAVKGLKDKIAYSFNYQIREAEFSFDEQKEINAYIKILLNRFSEIINICLRNKDLNNLSFILNQLHQTSNSYNSKLNNLKFDIQFKKTKKLTSEELQEVKKLENLYSVESFTNTTVRLIFKVTLFWSLFLFNTKVIDYPEMQKIIQAYEGFKSYIELDFVEDLLALRTLRYENDFSWGRWDFMDRMDGVVYTPPNVEFWVTLGAILYILRNKGNINFQLENRTGEEVNSHEYLISSMDQILKSLKETGFERFGTLIGSLDKSDFTIRINQLQERINALRNSTITNKEQQISQLNLDTEYVSNFKKIMCEGWEKGNAINELFTHFQSIVLVSEQNIEINFNQVGVKNQIWTGYKTCLIRNDDFYIPMFGIERLGENLANTEENIFFSLLLNKNPIQINDFRLGINAAIDSIQQSGYKPSIIMIGFDLWYNQFRDLNIEEFVFNWNDNQGYNFSDFGGSYKQIPIVKFRSDLLRDRVIVADFKASFSLQQEINQEAFKQVLVNNIQEITDKDAETIIAENPNYWENGLTHDQAKMKIMNSIRVDFYLLENFIIKDDNAYSLLMINK
jgi:hypothetical protein